MLRDESAGWRLAEVDDPGAPRQGEVRLRMLMAPVNPADRLVLAGAYAAAADGPVGAEGVGRIEEVGAGVDHQLLNRLAIPLSRGNWTQCRRLARVEIVLVPEALPMEQAAMLRINPATAWRMLASLHLERGDWLIQNAARSSVAGWVRRLAQERGIRTLNVVRDGKEAGSTDHPMPVGGEKSFTRVVEATGGVRPKAGLDAVAGDATGVMANCLAEKGSIIVYGHLSGQPCTIASMLLTTKGLRVDGFSLRPSEQGDGPEKMQALYDALALLAQVDPEPVETVFPFARIADALVAASSPSRRGRVLIALEGR